MPLHFIQLYSSQARITSSESVEDRNDLGHSRNIGRRSNSEFDDLTTTTNRPTIAKSIGLNSTSDLYIIHNQRHSIHTKRTMPSVIYEVEDAIGKRKREFNPIDERDIEREKEMQMKLAAARYADISTSPNPVYSTSTSVVCPDRAPIACQHHVRGHVHA